MKKILMIATGGTIASRPTAEGGLAPVITVNDKVYPTMTPDKASELLKSRKEEASRED